jgi:hypothetical protein
MYTTWPGVCSDAIPSPFMRGSHESGYHELIDRGRREIYQLEA